MKRKITELEQKLIDKGFKLDRKVYTGLHSEHTLSYVYKGVLCVDDEYNTFVYVNIHLDKTREKIDDFSIFNIYRMNDILRMDDIIELDKFMSRVQLFVWSLEHKENDSESGC